MLEELSKRNKVWLEFSYNICKDYDLANDLVQEMYLYFHDKNIEVNKSYVYRKIYHLFLDHCRKQSRLNIIPIDSLFYLQDTDNTFEPNDIEYEILQRYEELNWLEKELIQEHHVNEKSLRQIQKEYPMIDHCYAFRVIKNAKNKLNG